MIERKKTTSSLRGLRVLPGTRCLRGMLCLLGALALGGCSATHVGDAWQCPLSQGHACTSVAGADPAVVKAAERKILPPSVPLYLWTQSAAPAATNKPAPDCAATCNPFAWFARLFEKREDDAGSGGDGTENGSSGADESGAKQITGGSGQTNIVPVPTQTAAARADPSAPDSKTSTPVLAASTSLTAPLPPAGDDLRTAEVIGRIWIAPFVDAEGVYHEAGWVRAVLEPSGWRLP